jgi:hypothetical protein
MNCVSMTRVACCSFIVSAKSSLSGWLVWSCAVLVKSRYFSTQFSSFLIRSVVPGGSGAARCFLGLYVVTKVWSSS